MELFTIGYEGASASDLVATLESVGVEIVIDVRELPQSRRRGFSKNQLAGHLSDTGIEYRHFKQLGDPKHGRDAARAGRMDEFRQIFGAHIELPASREAIAQVADIVEAKKAVLLCYERNPKDCHRSIVAEHVMRLVDGKIRHLGVHAVGDRKAEEVGQRAARHT